MSIDEDLEVFNSMYQVAVLIDRPLEQVWRRFIDIPSWVSSHHIKPLQGKSGELNTILQVGLKGAAEENLPKPHYHYCKMILIVPGERWLQKTYSEKGGSYGFKSMTGYDDGRLYAVGDKTLATFNLFLEYRSEEYAKHRNSTMDEHRNEVSRAGMQKNLDNLKRILEEEPKRGQSHLRSP